VLLFDDRPSFPDGFAYIEDFITGEEEEMLCQLIQSIPLHTFIFQGHEAKRKVASLGYHYNFDRRSITKGASIPPAFEPLISKVASTLSIQQDAFVEMLITEYPVGSVINWHRDAMVFGLIAGISLLSNCIFKLRLHDETQRRGKTTLTWEVKRRSLYLMSGASRYDWQHAIAPVKSVRYSLTLRTLNMNRLARHDP